MGEVLNKKKVKMEKSKDIKMEPINKNQMKLIIGGESPCMSICDGTIVVHPPICGESFIKK